MSANEAPRSIALVLGSGGIVGGAFHAGVLKALLDTWDIDCRKADLVIGTSAGAISGAFIAGGLHPNDLFRRELQQPLSPAGQRLVAAARPAKTARVEAKGSIGRPAAPEVLGRAAFRPWTIAPGSVAAGLLPRGSVPTTHLGELIDALLGSKWPAAPELRICAVEICTGRRFAFDRDGFATPGQAGAASCSVPGVYQPVTIDDREFVDGGVHSADNLDVIGASSFDLVVVSSPMSSVDPLGGRGPWGMLRAATRAQTEVERLGLSKCPHVEIVRPTRKDLDAMGTNLLDRSRRAAVAMQAHASACAQFRAHASRLKSRR